jgi:glutamine amidotransferase
MAQVVAVVDYGMGNLHSVAKALDRVSPPGTRVQVTARADDIHGADRVVLPGVGAIRDCMHELRAAGLEAAVRQAAAEKPFLGICVGLQMLMHHSEENGGIKGLGIFAGDVLRFPEDMTAAGERLKVPHMGWNQVHHVGSHPLWQGIDDLSRFYFVHSFFVRAEHREMVIGSCTHGLDFDAVLADGNRVAVQFHPEKSARDGLQLLANFVAWKGEQ